MSETPTPRLWAARDLDNVKPVQWLAKGRLPRAAVTILVGDEGIGKSLLWVWIVAAVTTGRALPEFGIPERKPAPVLLVLTEDDWASTVRPRLEVAHADLDKIVVICEERDGSGSPVFPRDMPLVQAAPVALVVVDAFLDTVAPGLSMKDPQQARQALHPWREAALTTGGAVLLVTHTNRMDSKNPRDKYGISGELRKKARMTLYAQRDDEERLVVGPEKTNIGGRTPASMFTIDPVQMFPATEDTDGTVPLLRFVGESDKTAKEIVAAAYEAEKGNEGEDRTEAEQWLEDYLTQQGTTASAEVKKAAMKALRIPDRTLKRAAKDLGVVSESIGFPRVTFWSLPDSRATEPPRLSESGLTGPTERDLHKQNGPTEGLPQSGHAYTNGDATGPTAPPTSWTDPEWGECVLPERGGPVILDHDQFSRWLLAGSPAIQIPGAAA